LLVYWLKQVKSDYQDFIGESMYKRGCKGVKKA